MCLTEVSRVKGLDAFDLVFELCSQYSILVAFLNILMITDFSSGVATFKKIQSTTQDICDSTAFFIFTIFSEFHVT